MVELSVTSVLQIHPKKQQYNVAKKYFIVQSLVYHRCYLDCAKYRNFV